MYGLGVATSTLIKEKMGKLKQFEVEKFIFEPFQAKNVL